MAFLKFSGTVLGQETHEADARLLLYFRKIRFNGGPGRTRGQAGGKDFCFRFGVANDSVDSVNLDVEGVVAALESNVGKNEQKGRHANGQAHQVDAGENPLSPETAEGDLNIVFEHDGPV